MGKTANIMMKVFLVYSKTFYIDANGYELQMADGDAMPEVYLDAEKAIRRARQMSNNYCNKFGYQVAISNAEHPARKDRVLFAERLIKPQDDLRFEIRVFCELTWD